MWNLSSLTCEFIAACFVKAGKLAEVKVAVMKYLNMLGNLVEMCTGFHLAQLYACLSVANH